MSNFVAIIGRPNVGKSTLFNRLIQRREAIVDSTSGVTRDRHYGKTDWNGKEITLIDTGGYVVGGDDTFEAEIDQQVEVAIDEADAILFVVDVEIGVSVMDEEVARLLHRSDKPVLLVINKVDNALRVPDTVEFFALGIDKTFHISAVNGSGTGELLDAVIHALPDPKSQKTLTCLVLLLLAVPMLENRLLSMRCWAQNEILLRIKQARQETVLTPSITNTDLSLFLWIRQESGKNQKSKRILNFIR